VPVRLPRLRRPSWAAEGAAAGAARGARPGGQRSAGLQPHAGGRGAVLAGHGEPDRGAGVHRLVQVVIQARLGEEAERRWATAAVELVERSFPDESWEVATWPTCERLLPHALAATGHAERLRVAGEQASWLLGRASTYLRERGQYRQARPIAERALTITKEALGPADPETAWRHEELGSVLQALGDLAGAKAQLERALAIGEAALGPDHPTMAAARNNLGGVLWDLGELEGARVQLERALTVGEAALGPNHPTVAAIRVSLAGVLWDSPGAGVRRGSRTELLGIFVNTGQSKRFIPRLVSRLSQFWVAVEPQPRCCVLTRRVSACAAQYSST
jgi:hypothetical protein